MLGIWMQRSLRHPLVASDFRAYGQRSRLCADHTRAIECNGRDEAKNEISANNCNDHNADILRK